ncbi:ABC transporter permease [Microlunatus endophyticus]|uniref:ABC transporter permease n=1 Tax=Microlunatus endophyticus TaxID=1716077 RepID=A0A917S1V1_9ACTN|nr:ABC transporter permease [Microlunatus endophyticus]GGL52842.1 ABC transporter permease [Microlunatus endophyticus]
MASANVLGPELVDSEQSSGRADSSERSAFWWYLARKIITALISLLVVLVIGFVLFTIMPQNPVESIARASGKPMDAAQLAALRKSLGLDEPIWQRFGIYVWHSITLHLGYSYGYNQSVASLVLPRIGPTLLLTGLSTLISIVLGLWLGSKAGWRPGRWLDRIASGTSLVFWSVPTFWLGIILLIVLGTGVGPIPTLFPSGGMTTPGFNGGPVGTVLDVAWHLALPCVTLVLVVFAQYVTIMRSSLIDELGNPYLLTARAKGLRDDDVLRKHALPNALLPTVTVIFLQIGGLISGAITVETVFSWPGLGLLTYNALKIPDLELLQGTFVMFSASIIAMNLVADLLYRVIDPRVRAQ